MKGKKWTITLFSLFGVVHNLTIISSSPSVTLVKESENLDLFCESSEPYQWCYWAHNTSEYLTTAARLQTEENDLDFYWKKTSTRCGMNFKIATQELSGSWKCHLADTNAITSDAMR